MEAFIHGVLLAFGLILPLGVQNVFVFSQGATQPNLLRAMPAVITAGVCDTLLILLAVFGISAIVMEFESLRLILMSAGILFLIFMGFSIWRSKPAGAEEGKSLPPAKQIAFAASVSLLNPHAILDTVGVIGTSALRYTGDDRWIFILACIGISWLWFIGLAITGATLHRLDRSGGMLTLFNKASAVFIWVTALFLLKGLLE